MQIKKIELRRFMVHDHLDVELPERGIVLVTGSNGSGKSSIIEGIATACWGKTLRGDSPWREAEGKAFASIGDVWCLRSHKGQRTQLGWGKDGGTGTAYETNSKAQDALEKIIGSFDVWRRSHVFSSADASHFTLATDGERKRLLESVLGLDRFDDALASCRSDLKVSESRHAVFERRASVAEEEAAGRKRHLADAESELQGMPIAIDTPTFETRLTKLEKQIRANGEEIAVLQDSFRSTVHRQGLKAGELSSLQDQFERIEQSRCPACSQDIPEELRAPMRVKVKEAKQTFDELVAALTVERKEINGQQKELEEERGELEKLRSQVRTNLALAKHARDQRDILEGKIALLQREFDTAAENFQDLEGKITKANTEAETLRVVEQVLGLRGVRAQVLARTLSGIEQATNAWLAKIPGKVRAVALKPYVEKKSGGVTDAISIKVDIGGIERTYASASGGERRRVDVAFLLALAEVAAGARGTTPGTLFLDEIFDTLDKPGKEAIALALEKLAADRAVVVISHSDELAGALRTAKRIAL